RRLASMSTTHFLAQVGRLRIDRRQSIDGAERGRQPGQAAAVEAALEELRRLLCTHRARPRSEDHSDQPASIARGRGNDVVTRRTDESGLHAVSARITIDERIVIPHYAAAVADRRNVPVT